MRVELGEPLQPGRTTGEVVKQTVVKQGRLFMARSLSLYTYLCGASGTVLEPGMHARAWLCPTLQPNGLWPARLLCPWESPGQSTGVGCHVLLQGIFLTQGSNPGLLHCRQILYQLSHQGSPLKCKPWFSSCNLGLAAAAGR